MYVRWQQYRSQARDQRQRERNDQRARRPRLDTGKAKCAVLEIGHSNEGPPAPGTRGWVGVGADRPPISVCRPRASL